MKPQVLVACERSGRVRDALIAHGVDAVSCDMEPSDTSGPHITGDVSLLLRHEWKAIIGFPPCTDLAWSNGRHLPPKRADGRTDRAIAFARDLYDAAPLAAIENPRGDLWKWRRPDQEVNPWQFSADEPYTKRTNLWLKGLPQLVPVIAERPPHTQPWCQGTYNGKAGGLHRSAKDRSATFHGIADAMARAWSHLLRDG